MAESVPNCCYRDDATTTHFPFLHDTETKKYIQRSKVMFIIRGLPGSGKSHLAKDICKIFHNSALGCADNFRPPDVKYPFPKDILVISHRHCQDLVEKAAKEGTAVIVVDNSNLRLWEVQPYLTIALEYNYTEVVVEPNTKWKWNPVELAAKSTQGVPKEVIQKKLKSLDPFYPYFYAWFLNNDDSRHVRSVAEKVYGECLEQSTFVQEFLQHVEPKNEDGKVDLSQYFSSKEFDVGPEMLHCTAFYSDQGKQEGTKHYASLHDVKHNLGKYFRLQIIGFLITPHTFGARIQLDDNQLPLWNNDDIGNIPTPLQVAPNDSVGKLHEGIDQLNLNPEVKGDWQPTEFSPTCGPGSRAHLSIGTADGYKAVQVGIDLVKLVQDELNAVSEGKTDFLTVKIKSGVARCYGHGNWLIYFKTPLSIETLYSGYY